MFQLTGRCVLFMNSFGFSQGKYESNFVELGPAFFTNDKNETNETSSAIRRRSAIPQSLLGNSYYSRRFLSAKPPQPLHDETNGSCSMSSVSEPYLYPGDLLLRVVPSLVRRHLRNRPMVDVTGIRTSYFDASEYSDRALASVDEIVQTMHQHDGSEVPTLQRGEIPIGRLVPLSFCPVQKGHNKQGLPSNKAKRLLKGPVASDAIPLSRAFQRSVLVENAAIFFLGRRGSLFYHSDFEVLEMARMIASRCYDVCTQVKLQPRVRDNTVMGVQLITSP